MKKEETRTITKEEYNLIVSFLDKNKFSKELFINNSKTLVLKEVDGEETGYNKEENTISYNAQSSIVRDLLKVSSSTKEYSGICIKPNKVYTNPIGKALNEGITDLFLEFLTGEKGEYTFEKICAKVLAYAYGISIYNYYFTNDDTFRFKFNEHFPIFMINLDGYHSYVNTLKKYNREKDKMLDILMEIAIEDLLKVTSDRGKNVKEYLDELLKELK